MYTLNQLYGLCIRHNAMLSPVKINGDFYQSQIDVFHDGVIKKLWIVSPLPINFISPESRRKRHLENPVKHLVCGYDLDDEVIYYMTGIDKILNYFKTRNKQ